LYKPQQHISQDAINKFWSFQLKKSSSDHSGFRRNSIRIFLKCIAFLRSIDTGVLVLPKVIGYLKAQKRIFVALHKY
jgi:hypothetical protein